MNEYHHVVQENLDQDSAIIERHLDKARFEELLRLSEQLCLNNIPKYPEYVEPQNEEARLIASLGVLGVRHAIEIAMDKEQAFNDEIDGVPGSPPRHPLWRPELFNGPLNRELLAKAAATRPT